MGDDNGTVDKLKTKTLAGEANTLNEASAAIDRHLDAVVDRVPGIPNAVDEVSDDPLKDRSQRTGSVVPEPGRKQNRDGSKVGLARFREMKKLRAGRELTPEEKQEWNRVCRSMGKGYVGYVVPEWDGKTEKPEEGFIQPPLPAQQPVAALAVHRPVVYIEPEAIKQTLKGVTSCLSLFVGDWIDIPDAELEKVHYTDDAMDYVERNLPEWFGENKGAIEFWLPTASLFGMRYRALKVLREADRRREEKSKTKEGASDAKAE